MSIKCDFYYITSCVYLELHFFLFYVRCCTLKWKVSKNYKQNNKCILENWKEEKSVTLINNMCSQTEMYGNKNKLQT